LYCFFCLEDPLLYRALYFKLKYKSTYVAELTLQTLKQNFQGVYFVNVVKLISHVY